jgi:hypothetical protein
MHKTVIDIVSQILEIVLDFQLKQQLWNKTTL